MGYIETKLKDIEARIEKLESRRAGKVSDMAVWIKSKLEPSGYITVRRLKKEAEQVGYSWQMLQRVRRQLLNKEIEVKHEDTGWLWIKKGKKSPYIKL